MEKRPELNGIGHIGMVVGNVLNCVGKFKDVFGIDDFQIYDFLPDKAWTKGREIKGCRLKIAMASLKNGSQIEIIEPVSGDTPHMEYINSGKQGIHHISFYTGRYVEWLAYFRRLGIQILFEAEAEDEQRGYRRCFYAEDPELRCIVEFTEISDRGKKREV
jgi:hypothetical protein